MANATVWKVLSRLADEVLDSKVPFTLDESEFDKDKDWRIGDINPHLWGHVDNDTGEVRWTAAIEYTDDMGGLNYLTLVDTTHRHSYEFLTLRSEGKNPHEAVINLIFKWGNIKYYWDSR